MAPEEVPKVGPETAGAASPHGTRSADPGGFSPSSRDVHRLPVEPAASELVAVKICEITEDRPGEESHAHGGRRTQVTLRRPSTDIGRSDQQPIDAAVPHDPFLSIPVCGYLPESPPILPSEPTIEQSEVRGVASGHRSRLAHEARDPERFHTGDDVCGGRSAEHCRRWIPLREAQPEHATCGLCPLEGAPNVVSGRELSGENLETCRSVLRFRSRPIQCLHPHTTLECGQDYRPPGHARGSEDRYACSSDPDALFAMRAQRTLVNPPGRSGVAGNLEEHRGSATLRPRIRRTHSRFPMSGGDIDCQ